MGLVKGDTRGLDYSSDKKWSSWVLRCLREEVSCKGGSNLCAGWLIILRRSPNCFSILDVATACDSVAFSQNAQSWDQILDFPSTRFGFGGSCNKILTVDPLGRKSSGRPAMRRHHPRSAFFRMKTLQSSTGTAS